MQEKLTNRIKKGVQLLEEQQGYNKADILRRLETIEQGISPASMSNIMNDKEVGLKILNRARTGVETIILREIGIYRRRKITYLET